VSGAVGIERLNRTDAPAYAGFVAETEDALFWHTPEWLSFLEQATARSQPVTVLARENGRVVGAFVAFLKEGSFGVVLNALPYFGSHGDFLISTSANDPSSVALALAAAVVKLSADASVKAFNIVAHPLAPRVAQVTPKLGLTAWDRRIGQISTLSPAGSKDDALSAVLAACSQKTRNLVRKSLKQGFVVERSERDGDWIAMIDHHRRGMERIGGRAKSAAEFSAMRAIFAPDVHRRLYVARLRGEFAGALLCFYHRDWVEYFTPVAVEEFRGKQVLSALIAEALAEARVEGRRYWNWGGTWTDQSGVYHFKHGWGAVDHLYDYCGAVSGPMADSSPADLQASYPFFYVRPF
jgi:Acetyltransferase (GNAT) domain